MAQPLSAQTESLSSTVQTPRVKATLISETEVLLKNETLHLGVLFEIIPKWHIYWKNPGDSGEAPRFTWQKPEGVEIGEILWPAPTRFPLSMLANYGYENKILLPVPLNLSPDFKEDLITLKLKAEWLVCEEECIPESGEFALTLKVGDKFVSTPHNDLFQRTLNNVPAQLEGVVASHSDNGDSTVTLAIETQQLAFANDLKTVEIFPVNDGVFEAGVAPQLIFENLSGKDYLKATFTLTPQTLQVPELLQFLIKSPSNNTALEFHSQTKTLSTSPESSPSMTFAWALMAAFLGGLLLNLMPCVLPVLSLKAFSLMKNKDKKQRLRAEGIAFSLGVLISFALLAGALLLLRSGGEALGWGFQLQNPVFVILMAALFVVLALNFFGLFEMGLSLQAWIGRRTQNTGDSDSLSSSFGSGVLATLIATPCTAPFMGSAIGFALTLSAVKALAIFLCLGLGMALPILILSFAPKLLSILPRPGAWMETFKQSLGFPMLATAIWLLWVYGQQNDLDAVIRFLFSMIALSLSLWIWGRFLSSWKKTTAFVISLALTYWLAAPLIQTPDRSQQGTSSSRASQDYYSLEYENFAPARLQELRAQGTPVYVDFTAAWCLVCQVNKRVVFSDSKVQSLFKEKNIRILKADWTDKNAEILRELEKFGRSGVPLNLYYAPNSPEAHIFPSVLRAQIVLDAIAQSSP